MQLFCRRQSRVVENHRPTRHGRSVGVGGVNWILDELLFRIFEDK